MSPRSVSDVLKDAIYRNNTERVFIQLLEISHSELTETIRWTDDGRETAAFSHTFKPFPFALSLPEETDRGWTGSRVVIQNVHRDLVEAVRTISSAPTCKIWLVTDSDPDVIEAGPFVMTLHNVGYDVQTLEGEFMGPLQEHEPFPGHSFDIESYPGLN